jgi:glutathione S-transferase
MMKTELIFWGAGTGRSIRPLWVAEELGLEYQLNPIGPRTGETQTPEYTRLNPKQKIPFCEDGDLKLSESLAICRYLVNKYGDESTIPPPATIEEQAKQDEWLSYIYGEMDETSLYVMRRHEALASIYGEAPAAIEAARQYVSKHLQVTDQYLADKSFLLNERFSLPDIFLTTCLNWAEAYGIPLAVNLVRYRDEIVKRPAYQKADAINKQ